MRADKNNHLNPVFLDLYSELDVSTLISLLSEQDNLDSFLRWLRMSMLLALCLQPFSISLALMIIGILKAFLLF